VFVNCPETLLLFVEKRCSGQALEGEPAFGTAPPVVLGIPAVRRGVPGAVQSEAIGVLAEALVRAERLSLERYRAAVGAPGAAEMGFARKEGT
jgi:hypothetical protein